MGVVFAGRGKDVAFHTWGLPVSFPIPVENVKDILEWWVKNCAVYPHLLWMALDYLSIPGMFPFMYGNSR